nr:uncharacterized protein LOC128676096 [Plodia interpunctella]
MSYGYSMASCTIYFLVYFLLIEMNVAANSTRNYCPNTKTSLNAIRKRRHLAFPDGSAASITISGAKSFLTHVPSGWMMTTDLDVLFPLPDMKFTLAHARRKLHHRQKRNIWETLQTALNYHNYNGRACILKSICEAKLYLAPPGKSLVHDMLRVVFTSPSFEEEFRKEVENSFSELLDPNFCDIFYECPISFIQMMLAFNKPTNSPNLVSKEKSQVS